MRTIPRALLLSALLGCALPALGGPPALGPKLKRGDRGDSVRLLQHLLGEAGLSKQKGIAHDGDFGPATERALCAFQKAAQVPVSGRTDRRTWRALLKKSSEGPLGRINPLVAPICEDTYSLKAESPSVAMHLLPELETRPGTRAQPIIFSAKMSVDADGDGDAWRSDPTGQSGTSLQYHGGRSLNPTTLPYFVLPIGFDKKHPGMRLGDVAAVIYRGKVAYAIYGDRGPRGRIGEGSIKLAEELGINADPRTGGAAGGVFYVVFPGSGDRKPLSRDEIRARGSALLERAGGRPRARS